MPISKAKKLKRGPQRNKMSESLEMRVLPESQYQSQQQSQQQAQQVQAEDTRSAKQREQDQEIARLKSELSELSSRYSELEAASRVRQAVQVAEQPNQKLSTGAQDAARDAAIKACGGMARWMQLPPERRLHARGFPPATPEQVAEAERIFGSGNSSIEAASLARHNRGKYMLLRAIYSEYRKTR